MSYGLYISAEGAQVQSKRLEVLANNLANVNTPGFKRDAATFQARLAEAILQGQDYFGSGSINDLGGGVKIRNVMTDFSSGKIKQTGDQFDLAIGGQGFFQVLRGTEKLLTRAGNFSLDANHQLVTQQGYPVLGTSGSSITLDPALGMPEFAKDGRVFQILGDLRTQVAELALLNPSSMGDLVKTGENLFSPLAQLVPVPAAQRMIHPGYLELSGVKPILEMMELIEASRAFEANVNLIRNQDSMLGSLINRILGS